MATRLEWMFKMLDGISGPSGKMAVAIDNVSQKLRHMGENGQFAAEILDRTAKGMAHARAESEKAEKAQGNGGGGREQSRWDQFKDGVAVLDHGLNIAARFASAIYGIGSAAVNAGRQFMAFVVGVAGERESTLTALRTVLGDEAQAQRVWSESVLAAQRTPFETAQVTADRLQLVLSDFNAEESRTLYAASADIGAALGPERQRTIIEAFGRIRAQGVISGDTMRLLTSGGIGAASIYRAMAERAGRQDLLNNSRALAAWARARMPRMSGDEGISAVVAAVRSRFDHGDILGTFAAAQSHTLTGILSNLASLPHDLFSGFQQGIENISGIQGFKRTLLDFMALFDTGTTRGARFQAVIVRLTNALFGGLFGHGESQLDSMQQWFDTITDTASSFADVIERAAPAVRAFFGGFSTGALDSMSGVLGRLSGSDAFNTNTWEQLGTSIGHTIGVIDNAVRSLSEGLSNLEHPLTSIWDLVKGTVTGDMDAVVGHGTTSPASMRGVQPLPSMPITNAPTPTIIRHEHTVNVHATGDGPANQAAAVEVGHTVQRRMRDSLRNVDLPASDT